MHAIDLLVLLMIIASLFVLLTVIRPLLLRYLGIQQILNNQTQQIEVLQQIRQRLVRIVETDSDRPLL